MKSIVDEISVYRQRINLFIEEFLSEKTKVYEGWGVDVEKVLAQFKKIAMGGKRFRGYLMYLGYKLAGGMEDEKIIRASVFVELFHAGLLVQDDVMDRADKRRGEKTVHSVYSDLHHGEAMANLVGDLSFAWAGEVLSNSGFENGLLSMARKEFDKHFEMVVMGQMKDMENTSSQELLNQEDVEKVSLYKTAEYSGVMSLVIGARLAGNESREFISNLEGYGRSLGMAFQLRDDYLWVDGDEGEKSLVSDLEERKQTILTVHFFKVASDKDRQEFESIWGRKINEEQLDRARELIKESGSYEYIRGRALRYVDRGKKLVDKLTEDRELRRVMDELLELMVERKR